MNGAPNETTNKNIFPFLSDVLSLCFDEDFSYATDANSPLLRLRFILNWCVRAHHSFCTPGIYVLALHRRVSHLLFYKDTIQVCGPIRHILFRIKMKYQWRIHFFGGEVYLFVYFCFSNFFFANDYIVYNDIVSCHTQDLFRVGCYVPSYLGDDITKRMKTTALMTE